VPVAVSGSADDSVSRASERENEENGECCKAATAHDGPSLIWLAPVCLVGTGPFDDSGGR
jgi:hypothetical protein